MVEMLVAVVRTATTSAGVLGTALVDPEVEDSLKTTQLTLVACVFLSMYRGRILGERAGGAPPPREMTCGFLIQLVFCEKKTMWFIGVEVEQETSARPPKKILDPPLMYE